MFCEQSASTVLAYRRLDCALLVVESKTDHDSQNHALLHYFSA